MTHHLSVLVQTPAHSAISGPLTYRSESILAPGTLVRVPLGNRETLGVVWAHELGLQSAVGSDKVRGIISVLDAIAPLGERWQQLVTFAADYYQRSAGEVALVALPPQLRDLTPGDPRPTDGAHAPGEGLQGLEREQHTADGHRELS